MSWLAWTPAQLAITAAKAALMYGTAVIGLRLGERRTLSQWTAIDFAAAVAIGAIVGRTAVAKTESYAVGAIALISIIAVHRLASLGRFSSVFNKLVDHRIRVLVRDGELRRRQLRLCGLTDNDLYAQLRQRGYISMQGLHLVLYETKGGLTVVPDSVGNDAQLIDNAIAAAAGWPPPETPET